MKWIKKGLIFSVDNNAIWMKTHAQVPTVDDIGNGRLRIFFSTRNADNISHIGFLEIDTKNPKQVLYVHDKPVLTPGKIGTFDDCGIMPSWVVNHKGEKYLYYVGWNVRNTVPYHNSIGLAKSCDGGLTFERYSEGPILDRNYTEPYFGTLGCILLEGSIWRMWYLSCTKWVIFNGKPEPYYNIKYAESKDGIKWIQEGKVCIDFKNEKECGIARSCVIKEGNIYKMWYSYRNLENYRTDRMNSYRIGYAESKDGLKWERRDGEAGIDVSENGWDSQMIEYPCVYEYKGTRYMFYNGNGFGRTGFGYAIMNIKSDK